jgi:O-antigen ligase
MESLAASAGALAAELFPALMRASITPLAALLAMALLVQLHAATSFLILPLLAAAGLLLSWKQPSTLDRRPDALETAVLIWLLCWLLSAVTALHVRHAFALSVPTLVFALMFALLYRGRDPRLMDAGLAALFVLATVQTLGVLFAALTPGTPQQWVERIQSPWLLVPNDVVWMLCLWPLWWARVGMLARRWRLTLGLLLLLQVVAMLLLQSRLAILVLIGLALAWALDTLRIFEPVRKIIASRPWWSAIGLLLLMAGVAAVLIAFGKGQASLQARWQLWQAAWALWLAHPWLGVGPHGFGLEYLGVVNARLVDPRHTPWPHQLPLELLANIGLIGFLAFSRVGIQTVRRCLGSAGAREFPLGPLAASLLAFATASLLEASTLRLWWWVLLAYLLGSLWQSNNKNSGQE